MSQNKYSIMSNKYKAHCRKYYIRQEKLLIKQQKEAEERRFKIHKEPSILDKAFDVLKIIGLIIIVLALLNLTIQGFTG